MNINKCILGTVITGIGGILCVIPYNYSIIIGTLPTILGTLLFCSGLELKSQSQDSLHKEKK
jgi:hypothetical protein